MCELKFSSALNRGQRKLIQLSVEANNLLFSQRKKVLVPSADDANSLAWTHTPSTNRSAVSVECHHQRTLPVALMDGVFLNLALCSPTTQLNQAGRLKESARTNTSAVSKLPFRLRQLCILVLLSLFISLKLRFLCRTNSACHAVVTVWCYLCSYWVWLLLLWEWGGNASSYRRPGQLRMGRREGNLSFLYYMLGGMKSEPPSCPLSPSCWCLKLIGGVGSFTRLGSLWVWSKEQLELATGRSVCDVAQGECQWANLSVVKTSALVFISLSDVVRANCMFTCL